MQRLRCHGRAPACVIGIQHATSTPGQDLMGVQSTPGKNTPGLPSWASPCRPVPATNTSDEHLARRQEGLK